MVVNQNVAKDLLSKVMTPGKRYFVKDLQELFKSNYEDWVEDDFDTNNAIGEAWEMHVKNCVRLSPCRQDYANNSWPELNCERVGRNWSYWIGNPLEDIEQPKEPLPRISERKRPRGNDGWVAEKFVKADLEEKGFTVANVSSGGYGCDLLAFKDGSSSSINKGRWDIHETWEHIPQEEFIRVEVKSSVERCHPSLTMEEMEAAKMWGSDYWLAIVDNFDPLSEEDNIRIHYIKDPSSFESKERVTVTYGISRASLGLEAGEDLQKSSPCEDCSNKQFFGIDTFERYFPIDGSDPVHAVRHFCETCGTVHTATMRNENWKVDETAELDGEIIDECPENPDANCEPFWDDIEYNGGDGCTLLMPCQFCGTQRWYLLPEFLDWSC